MVREILTVASPHVPESGLQQQLRFNQSIRALDFVFKDARVDSHEHLDRVAESAGDFGGGDSRSEHHCCRRVTKVVGDRVSQAVAVGPAFGTHPSPGATPVARSHRVSEAVLEDRFVA